jgi:dienelactone hydrolase
MRLSTRPRQAHRGGLRALLVPIACLTTSGPLRAQERVEVPRADGAHTPLRVYSPPGGGCSRLAVISPGAGGTESGYAYLARGLSDRGWLAIVMGHQESGPGTLVRQVSSSGLHGGLRKMVTDATAQRDRIHDLDAALAWSAPRCHGAYKALLGHSMGSDTVMFEAGALNQLEVHGANRFDAYVAVSPAGEGPIFAAHSWRRIDKPMYVLTGTRDAGLEGDWHWRAQPFEDLPPGCAWLGVIDDATHLNFAGIGLAAKTEKLTLASVAAFLAAAQARDCAAPPAQPSITFRSRAR